MLTFKNYNIADWFSFYRIAASPFLFGLIWLDEQFIFACLLAVSYSTDAIDGFLARKLKLVSPRGSQLDSFGDQITLIIGLIGLFYFEKTFIMENLTIIIIVFIPYIIQMILAYIKYGKATAFHTYLAKTSAIMQSAFILYALFFDPNYTLFYVMIVIGLLETFEEIVLIFMHKHWVSDIKGIYWAYKSIKTSKKQES
ncbi:CDP-alcohol phosphatidyltransferase family protein [Psychroserpens sp.]|uniref:CDP-alcohol phosphatidyltransferase family protein n=1 Tax=Psychroserpens sp. TaxID=2020870 RepID=UPI001B06B2EF|nr:CDP-alcohol phosphatidyltransferase family protein [Psychroserpens sp.]MBO6607491.1 CDP-alcohol phosphatidyltransferase family protein [Psychroserpens sp.]MBO6632711.1 CDP-alcohol phosphatidyltransferase family protein [Psychroserpens sp.]MBO6654431.1 CDP-alcohol phosphatidyltransferase family protein [Psychroserpens sp.]MBO6681220.1 CDP-alcohol phosphatidyltransferase family protein [Psychroserpens sp.]MBO6749823.1 CDP-alcohol phosphatidyltransferase family protein [Psychroserpens sp.]